MIQDNPESPDKSEAQYGLDALKCDLFTRIVNAPDIQIEAEIGVAIRRIIEFLSLDLGILLQWGEELSRPVRSRSWIVPRTPVPITPSYPNSRFWANRMALGGEPVICAGIDDLPQEAEEDKAFFRRAGMESLLAVPLTAAGSVFGVFIAASRHRRVWPDEILHDLKLIVGVLAGALTRNTTRLELEAQLRFQALLADISTKFVNVPADQVDLEISAAQQSICASLSLDRCALWQTTENKPNTAILTHIYQPAGFPFGAPGLDATELFPWTIRKAAAGEVLAISRLSDLPPEAARDLESYRMGGTKSCLVVPLSVGTGVILGALTFGRMNEERDWSERSIKQLVLVAQVFANALARKRSDVALRESHAFAQISLDCARAGIWSVQFDPPEIWLSPKMREMCLFTPNEDLTPERFLNLVHPDDREMVDRAVRQAVEARQDLRIQHRVVVADGSTFWVEAHGRFHPELSGNSGRLTGISMDITEHKLAEAAFQASEDRFRGLIEQAPVPIGISRDGKILHVNKKYLEVFGYQNLEELRTRPIIEQWAPQCREQVREITQRYDQGLTTPTEFEAVGRRRDGAEISIHAIVTRVQLSDGPASVAFLRDITGRKLLLDATLKAEEKYRTIFNEAQEGIYRISPEGKPLAANPALAKMLGYDSPEDLLSDTARQIWMEPRERSVFIRLVEEQGVVTRYETRFLRKDKTPIWVSISCRKACGPDGRTLYYEGLSADITDRKRAEEALRESETRYRLLAENSTDVIWTTDLSGRLTYVSPSVEKLRGFSVREVMAQQLHEAFTPDSARAVRLVLQSLGAHGRLPPDSNRLELSVPCKDGSSIWTEADISILYDDTGRAQGLLGHSRDITDKRMIEHEIRQLRDQTWRVERLARAGVITVSLAHALNQPLAAILSNAQAGLLLLARQNPNLEEIRDILNDIVDDDKRAGDVIGSVRGILRREQPRRERISLTGAIREMVTMLRSDLQEHRIAVDMSRMVDCAVVADKAQIQQLLLNLIMNAIEAMQVQPPDERRLDLSVSAIDGEARVAVRDSGPGIPDHQIGRMLVEPFRTTKNNGLGIGLMICRSIIESHAGRMWLANNPDRGMTFFFTLPLQPDE